MNKKTIIYFIITVLAISCRFFSTGLDLYTCSCIIICPLLLLYAQFADKPEGFLFHFFRYIGEKIIFISSIFLVLSTLIILFAPKFQGNHKILLILSIAILIILFAIFIKLIIKLNPTKAEQLKSQIQTSEEDLQFVDELIYSLNEPIKELENKRFIQLFITIFTYVLLILISSVGIFLSFYWNNKGNSFNIFLSNGIVTFITFLLITKFFDYVSISKTDYIQSFKENIITEIIKYVGIQNLQYFPYEFIPKTDFHASKLFYSGNIYKGDDLITGEISSLKFKCSELHVQNIDSDSKDEIFHGLFFVIDIPVNIQIPFGTNSNFGNEILLDNTEFNELFKVFGNDSTEVFYILSSKVIEKMVNFVRKTGHNFQFSFKGNKLYIAIESAPMKRFFEPPIFKSLWDYKIYDEIVMDFKLIFELLNQLEFRRSLS